MASARCAAQTDTSLCPAHGARDLDSGTSVVRARCDALSSRIAVTRWMSACVLSVPDRAIFAGHERRRDIVSAPFRYRRTPRCVGLMRSWRRHSSGTVVRLRSNIDGSPGSILEPTTCSNTYSTFPLWGWIFAMGVVAEDPPSERIVDVRAGFPPSLIVSGAEVVGKIDGYMRRSGRGLGPAPSVPDDTPF